MSKQFIAIGLALNVFCFMSVGCAGSESESAESAQSEVEHADEHEDHEESNVVVNQAGGYGEVITAEGAMSCEQLLGAMSNTEETQAKVEGVITSVCQMAGCWMKMDCVNGEQVRVTFKDYGFFVPKDMAGSRVVVEGVAVKKELSVETLRHFAEDEGKSAEEVEAITEPAWEYEFIASGVMPLG